MDKADLLQYTSGEKRYDRYDSNNPHITDPRLNSMLDTPEYNRHNTYETHPILLRCKWLSRRSDRFDLNITFAIGGSSRFVGDKEKQPNEDYRDR